MLIHSLVYTEGGTRGTPFPTLDCAQAPIYSATSSSQSEYGFGSIALITVVNDDNSRE